LYRVGLIASTGIVVSVGFGSKPDTSKKQHQPLFPARARQNRRTADCTGLKGRPCNGEEIPRLRVGLCVYRSAQPATERGDHAKRDAQTVSEHAGRDRPASFHTGDALRAEGFRASVFVSLSPFVSSRKIGGYMAGLHVLAAKNSTRLWVWVWVCVMGNVRCGVGESSLVARSPPIETSRRQAQRSRWHTHRAHSTQACSRAVQGLLRIVLSVGSSDLSPKTGFL
jgi:hypothetical protein